MALKDIPEVRSRYGVKGFSSRCRVYRFAAQNIPNGVWTRVDYDTRNYDTLQEFDIVAAYNFTPNHAGYYAINCLCRFGNIVGVFVKAIRLVVTGGATLVEVYVSNDPAIAGQWLAFDTIEYLTPLTPVQVNVFQNSGGVCPLTTSTRTNYLCVHRLS